MPLFRLLSFIGRTVAAKPSTAPTGVVSLPQPRSISSIAFELIDRLGCRTTAPRLSSPLGDCGSQPVRGSSAMFGNATCLFGLRVYRLFRLTRNGTDPFRRRFQLQGADDD